MSKEPDDLMAFTHTLAAVHPDPGRLNRDALLFAAGRAAGRRGAFWPALAGALAALSVALGVVLVMRPPTFVEVERVVLVPTPVPTPADAPESEPAPSPENLPVPTQASPTPGLTKGLHLRQRVLRDGVESLPQASFPFVDTPRSPSPDDVPDLPSLRLNASHPDGGPFR